MWEPKTEEQIAGAIADGNLSESAWIDVKAEVGDTDSSRKETAKDLASFAIGGGALLVGVHEDKERRQFKLAPIGLAGEVERIEQIAAMRVDPPLFVRVREIPTSADPDRGYLWVDVPPSPQSPHMVNGIYYARGERTTRRLTDAEVDTLHRTRSQREALADRALDEEVDRDPVASGRHGHLYLVAEPLSAPTTLARAIVRSGSNTALLTLVDGAEGSIPSDLREIPPRPMYASHYSNRSRGSALTSLNESRTLEQYQQESNAIDIELHEGGSFRVFCGRLTDDTSTNAVVTSWIVDGLAVAYAFRLVHWVRQLSEETGYRGSWSLGVAGSGLKGLQSSRLSNAFTVRANPYDVDTYRRTTTAPFQELTDAPHQVVERLVGPLVRGLGVELMYGHTFAAPGQ